VELHARIRRAVMVDGLSRREAATFWRSSEHDHEDASVFGSARLPAARTASFEEAGPANGVDRRPPRSGSRRAQEAASQAAPHHLERDPLREAREARLRAELERRFESGGAVEAALRGLVCGFRWIVNTDSGGS
jgi:hypothetical protein